MRWIKISFLGFLLASLITSAMWAGETKDKKQVQLDVKGMMCGGCVSKVKNALQKVDGVESADVNLENNSAVVKAKKDVKTEDLVKAVEDAGFKASPGKEKSEDKK